MGKYIVTNGSWYLAANREEALKTQELEKACVYSSVPEARKAIAHNPKKTRGYYVFDMESQVKITKHDRRKYTELMRQTIYSNENGKCYLCGIEIQYENMELDHKNPLANGGEDNIENVFCCCHRCNQLKGSMNIEEFNDKIEAIFTNQMKKKYGKTLKWKIVSVLLKKFCQ